MYRVNGFLFRKLYGLYVFFLKLYGLYGFLLKMYGFFQKSFGHPESKNGGRGEGLSLETAGTYAFLLTFL